MSYNDNEREQLYQTQKPDNLTKEDFNLLYEDFEGKVWRFCRLKFTRKFVREDGKCFSHSHVYNNYDYQGKIL